MKENKNIIIAVVLCLMALAGLEALMPSKKTVPTTQQPTETVSVQKAPEPVAEKKPAVVTDPLLLGYVPTLPVQNEHIKGKVSTAGGRIEQVILKDYKETVEKDSPEVEWLSKSFFAEFTFSGNGVQTPTTLDEWKVSSAHLTPEKPVLLLWTNKDGITFERKIAVDDKYMFTITDTVKNTGDKPFELASGASLIRQNPNTAGAGTVHEGFVGFLKDALQEERYAAAKEKKTFRTNNGWIGQTDKYWLAALAFDGKQKNIQTAFDVTGDEEDKTKTYISSFQTQMTTVPVGGTYIHTTHLFAGPKVLKLIEGYQDKLDIERFELAIDFGWYYFLTKPFLMILSLLNRLVGNMGIAILVFATLLRLLMLPVAAKSFESTAKMKKIQPQMKRLQELYKGDKMRLNQEMMRLYQKEKVNPASGCLPMMIQIPVFFSLYKVLSVSIEMRQAPFFGWIRDLSVRDPSSVFSLFGYAPWPVPSLLNIGVWPVLMGITMLLQQKMSPQPTTNRDQLMVMKWLPVIFTFMMGQFAAGLIIYWTWSNVLSMIQQKHIMKKYGG